MTNLYSDQFCDLQPLNVTNSIQAHGVLLVLEKTTGNVVQISENAKHWFGKSVQELLNAPFDALVRKEDAEAFWQRVRTGEAGARLPFTFTFKVDGGDKTYACFVQQFADHLIIEVEFQNIRVPNVDSFVDVFQKLQQVTAAINAATTVEDVALVAAGEIKRISGYDKVMIYTFDSEWHGTVIAEASADGMERYLGLKFPATDIPKPARDLYLKNPYRIISDVHSEPVPLLPQLNPVTGAPTDLTDSRLRSIVPVHTQYLKNMNVAASMSTRIIYKEQLWGLIACHHRTARYLTFEECTLFEFISSVISSRINSILAKQTVLVQTELYRLSARCLESLSVSSDLYEGLISNTGLIKQILKADFVVITMAGKYYAEADTLNESEIAGIVAWLQQQASTRVVHIPSMASVYPAATDFANIASGILALPVNAYEGSYILAFRKECIQLVNWGGNPAETIRFSGGTYNPRHSFEVWQETVRYSSIPWSEEECKVAEDFKNAVVEQALRLLTISLEQKVAERTVELQQSNARLNDAHKQLRELTFLTTHRLQEGVRRIRLMVDMLHSDSHEIRVKRMNEISTTSEKMQALITQLEAESKAEA